MSQTVTQVSVPTNVSLQAQSFSISLPSKGFPDAWLLPSDDQVITKAQWNHEEPPADAPYGDEFTVDWPHSNSAGLFTPSSRGVIGPTIVRHYFGLVGCIIPIASIPMLGETPAMIFTIAGPADAEGKKQFYVYFHNSLDLSATKIYRLSRFATVADFFRNSEPWKVCVPPVSGGEDMAKQELNKFGYSYDEPLKNAIQWGAEYLARKAAGLVVDNVEENSRV
ncbi:hypothetical protein GGX14DRAFT_559529 [Mycena pura]|uniref:Uncharacterized protein n=1 Tax=Mycena pura TaxID=153505 RepID=A0AAD6YHT5_9AGAR|nr:hypothetical protein GGX14DRAFT_559529 [Mycena pura]